MDDAWNRNAARDSMPLADLERNAAQKHGWTERQYKDARVVAMNLVEPMSPELQAAITLARSSL